MGSDTLLGWVLLWLLDRATEEAPVSSLAPFLSSQVPWSLVAGAALLETALGLSAWGGLILIVGAIAASAFLL